MSYRPKDGDLVRIKRLEKNQSGHYFDRQIHNSWKVEGRKFKSCILGTCIEVINTHCSKKEYVKVKYLRKIK